MTTNFDKFFSFILEGLSSSENFRNAERYFAIGHQDDTDDDTLDYCWLWFNDSLKVGSGATHKSTFGYNMEELARFKGWYDTGKDILSFVDRKGIVTNKEEIPQRVYDHLMRKFNPKTIMVF